MANSSDHLERRLVFFDASVLDAAARSPSGGSAVALEVCHGQFLRAAVTEEVLLEARVNIAEKFGETELVRFYRLLAEIEPEIVAAPSHARLDECLALATEKDAHVLAAALDRGAEYLFTLDRRYLLSPAVLAADLPFNR